MVLKMRNKHYLFIALALLNTFASLVSAQEFEEQRNEMSDLISADTAEVVSKFLESGARVKRSDYMLSQEDTADDVSAIEGTETRMKNFADDMSSLEETATEGASIERTEARVKRSDDRFSQEDTAEETSSFEGKGARIKRSEDMIDNLVDELVGANEVQPLEESREKIPQSAQSSIRRVKRLLDNLNESKRKRSSGKDTKNRLAVNKRSSNKEKKHKDSEIGDSEEDQAEKQKIKRRAKEEMKRLSSKKGKKRSSKKVKKHVGARCTEPSSCNACQTTIEEFTLPTTTESECCETKPKCKPTTTRCRTTTTPCDSGCDTCRLKEEDAENSQEQ